MVQQITTLNHRINDPKNKIIEKLIILFDNYETIV